MGPYLSMKPTVAEQAARKLTWRCTKARHATPREVVQTMACKDCLSSVRESKPVAHRLFIRDVIKLDQPTHRRL